MDAASPEERAEHSPQTPSPQGAPLFRLLSRGSFALAALAAATALLLVYRLWTLSTSRLPHGFPEGWLLDLSDLVVGPFRGYDHTAGVTKATGFVDFPALIALEVCLVATLVFAVFAYLFHLLQPREREPAPAPRSKQQRQPSWVRHGLREAAVRGNDALRRGVTPVVAGVQRRDWAGYRLQAAMRWTEASTFIALTAWRAYLAYRAGVRRDAASLRRYRDATYAAARRRYAELSPRLRRVATSAPIGWSGDAVPLRSRLRRTRRRIYLAGHRAGRRVSAGLAQAPSTAGAALSRTGGVLSGALERGSSWYWGNFDAASNRVAALVSKSASDEPQAATEAPESTTAADTDEQISRREFLRRLKPLP